VKICVVTGTRAEYGLLKGLISLIDASDDYELQLVVTGTHLSDRFGRSIDFISSEGFEIAGYVPHISFAETGKDVAAQIGAGTSAFTEVFSTLEPDALVIVGDRYEVLAAALAAFFLQIPIVHIHGGEVTQGAFDDTIRHMTTKLSTLHCVAHERYAQRVIQLGEQPDSVHVVGSLGVDQLSSVQLLAREELESGLGIQLIDPLFLVTYHPVTSGENNPLVEVEELIAALEAYSEATVIFSMPNGDPNHQIISAALMEAVDRHQPQWLFRETLGQVNYWSLMAIAAAVVGNSSSGILEAPSFPSPTVNIGPRQSGRIRADSVIESSPDRESISMALQKVMSADFRRRTEKTVNPLGGPGATQRIFSLLSEVKGASLGPKSFYDLGPDDIGGWVADK